MALSRFQIEGHIYYVTTVIYPRLPIFCRPSFVIPLLDSLNFYRYKQAFRLLGYVIMPDHLHLIIWPYGAATVSHIMRDLKEFTAKRLVHQAEVEDRRDWLAAFRLAGEETERAHHKVWQDKLLGREYLHGAVSATETQLRSSQSGPSKVSGRPGRLPVFEFSKL